MFQFNKKKYKLQLEMSYMRAYKENNDSQYIKNVLYTSLKTK